MNPKLEATLLKLVIPNTTISAFVPAGGLSSAPFATLLGRRVIFTEQAAAVGTVGDIVLVCPRNFYAITKGGPKASVSLHLYFDQGLVAYRTTIRMAVGSKRTSVITRPDATTVGDVAVLQTRS